MLYLIFYYFLITGICLCAGILIYSFIPLVNPGRRSPIHFLVTGLIGLTVVGQWIVLFSPVNMISLLGILILCGVISVFRKRQIVLCTKNGEFNFRNKSVLFYTCVLCFMVMILIINAGPVAMDDTDSYHVQMVKWIQEFGSVPGIANLHLRFGFNSSWFSSIALLSYPISGLNTYISLNGLLSVWFCYFLLEKTFEFAGSREAGKMRNGGFACLCILFLCLLNWPMIRGSASSANYDFISCFCIIVLFVDLYDKKGGAPVEWLIWPVYLFTVRMTNFPILILSLVFVIQTLRSFSFRRLAILFSFAAFVIVPFLVRNIILSGYAFFPVYQIDFFSPDWKVDKMKLIEISNYIKYFNRVNPMFQPLSVTEKLNFPNWVSSWYNYLFKVDKIILSFSAIGYAIISLSQKKLKTFLFSVFFFVMLFQMITWFFIDPDPRFVYGPIVFGIFAGVISFSSIKESWTAIMKYSLLLTSLVVLVYGISKTVRDNKYRNYLIPRPLPVPAVQTIQVGGIQMHIPEKILNNWNPRCYDIELPCLYKKDPRLEARGGKIANGFRLKSGGNDINSGGEYKIHE
jgi:hypothetical protein